MRQLGILTKVCQRFRDVVDASALVPGAGVPRNTQNLKPRGHNPGAKPLTSPPVPRFRHGPGAKVSVQPGSQATDVTLSPKVLQYAIHLHKIELLFAKGYDSNNTTSTILN